MTIYIDSPKYYHKFGLCCHCISDVGTEELVQFVVSLGLSKNYIQKQGTIYEHFDLMNSKINLAKRKGAIQINDLELARKIQQKVE